MNEENYITDVDISIGTNMYGRISDLPNTPSHVIAEFIDNSIQSSRDKRDELLALDPFYRLCVTIDFKWDDKGNPLSLTILDNAGGIDRHSYNSAFKLATTPENNQGLNEYGMGLKTAALWLGDVWSVESSAIGESESRTIVFNLTEVMESNLKKLVVTNKESQSNTHYTRIFISQLSSKAPSKRSIATIRSELCSIYRKFLRNDEIDIIVNGEKLSFSEIEILNAPPAKDPNAPSIIWRKEIDKKFGKYSVKGFIGILKDINSTNNGLVLLRRDRVVYGATVDGRYFPKSLCGSKGTFRYKRIFGELELEGFSVAFNKNDLLDKENLEALMRAIKSEIHQKNFDLYNQAEDYRLDTRQKEINRLVRSHTTSKKKNATISIDSNSSKNISTPTTSTHSESIIANEAIDRPVVMGITDDTYLINGNQYELKVELVDKGRDLVWLDSSNKSDNIVICKINARHIFFQQFQKADKPIVALLKTMALAKFMAKEKGNDSTGEFFEAFNEYINKAKV